MKEINERGYYFNICAGYLQSPLFPPSIDRLFIQQNRKTESESQEVIYVVLHSLPPEFNPSCRFEFMPRLNVRLILEHVLSNVVYNNIQNITLYLGKE